MQHQSINQISETSTSEVTTSASVVVPFTYSSFIDNLKNGSKLLSMLGDFNFQEDSSATTESASISLRDLLFEVKDIQNQTCIYIKEFLEDLFQQFIVHDKITPSQVIPIIESARRILILKAGFKNCPRMRRVVLSTLFRYKCGDCGFMFPKYPGRYPCKCPVCQTPVDKSKFGNFDAFYNVGESEDISHAICLKCGFIQESPDSLICRECGTQLTVKSSISEMKAAILEIYFLCSSIPINGNIFNPDFKKLVELFNVFNVPIREANIFNSFLFNRQSNFSKFFCDAVTTSLVGDRSKPLLETFSLLTEQKIFSTFNSFDRISLSACYPFIFTISEKTGIPLFNKISNLIVPFVPIIFDAVSDIKSWLLTLDEKTQNNFASYLDLMYTIHLNPVDINESYTTAQADNFANSVIGNENLSSIRAEVSKRPGLRKAIESLSIEKFDLGEAVKAYSSCLTRVCIEHELKHDLCLDLFRSVVFSNMQGLFEGNRVKSINFLKGVFLPINS